MRVKPRIIFLLGTMVAISLSSAVTIPYVSAWWNLLQSREMNVVPALGETHMLMEGVPSSLVNITIIAVYPEAVVESRSRMFVVHLVFYVIVDSNIAEFICDEIEAVFSRSNWSYDYWGHESLGWGENLWDFYHYSSEGKIAPFFANVSIRIDPNSWPPFPQDISHMLYLADRFETSSFVQLHGRFHYPDGNGSVLVVFFNMTKYTTTVYRFNFPITLWIVYGGSLFIVVAVSANLLYNHQQKKKVLKQ